MQIGIGRRWLVVEMVERAAPAAAPAPWTDGAALVEREARAATQLRERDRATARAMGWWYGLYGTGR